MTGLSKEEIIMSSNDNSVTLTTHRILQKTARINKEIFLEDVVSNEVIKKRGLYYKVLTLFFGIPTLAFFNIYLSENSEPFMILSYIFVFFTTVSILFLLTTHKKFLKISGRFNEIEFSINDLSHTSLNKFVTTLSIESENRKKEKYS